MRWNWSWIVTFLRTCCSIEHRSIVEGSVVTLAEQPLALYVDVVCGALLAGRSRAIPTKCRVFIGLLASMR
jgi:hypothetical protein